LERPHHFWPHVAPQQSDDLPPRHRMTGCGGLGLELAVELLQRQLAALEASPGIVVGIGSVDAAQEVPGQTMFLLETAERLEGAAGDDSAKIPKNGLDRHYSRFLVARHGGADKTEPSSYCRTPGLSAPLIRPRCAGRTPRGRSHPPRWRQAALLPPPSADRPLPGSGCRPPRPGSPALSGCRAGACRPFAPARCAGAAARPPPAARRRAGRTPILAAAPAADGRIASAAGTARRAAGWSAPPVRADDRSRP